MANSIGGLAYQKWCIDYAISGLGLLMTVYYIMASTYFGNDYFEAGADLSLPFPMDYEPQRKPSYDDILIGFLNADEQDPISNVTPESSLSKSKANDSTEKSEKKTKKRRKDSKTLP